MGFYEQLIGKIELAYEEYVLYIAKSIIMLRNHLDGEELVDKTADILDEFAKAASLFSDIKKHWS